MFLPLTNVNIEDDASCQPLSSTPVKTRVSGSTGKHSLTPNSKSSNEPNRKRLQRSAAEGYDSPTTGYWTLLFLVLTGYVLA